MNNDLIYGIGQGWIFLFLIIGFYLAAEVGFRVARRLSNKVGKEATTHIATIEGALLGLLALLLGFAFSMSISRYDSRKAVIIEEANDLQTTYLRAELLSDPHKEITKRFLRDYVDSRVEYLQAGLDELKLGEALARTARIQNQLWNQAVSAAKSDSDEVRTGYFISSLNSLIDDHTVRVNAMRNHVPEVILFLLIFVGAMTIAMTGYSSGINNLRLPIPRAILIVLTAATLIVIIDLDRPRRGLITVSEKALTQLQKDLKAPVSK